MKIQIPPSQRLVQTQFQTMPVKMLPRNIPCLLPVLQVQLGAQRLRMNLVTSHCPSRKDWTNCLKDWKGEMLSGCKTSVKLSNLLIGKLVPDCVVDMPASPRMIFIRMRDRTTDYSRAMGGKFDQELPLRSPVPRQRTMYVSDSLPKKKALETNKQRNKEIVKGRIRTRPPSLNAKAYKVY